MYRLLSGETDRLALETTQAVKMAAPHLQSHWRGLPSRWQQVLPAWEDLQNSAGFLPTQSAHWAAAAYSTLRNPDELRLVTVGSNEVCGIAPLVAARIGSVGHLALLSQSLLGEPMDFLYRDDEAAKALLHSVLSMGKPVCLERVSAQSRVLTILRQGRVREAIHWVRPSPGCPVVRLNQRWRNPFDCLASRRRQDLRAAWRKALHYGRPEVSITRPASGEVDRLLDQAIEIEAASWKGDARTALKYDPARRTFFRRYAQLMAARGELVIAMLQLGQEPAAMQLAVESYGSLWLLKIGYDRRFASCSPGQMLMCEVIADAAQRELRAVEFLGTIAPWTRAWTHEQRDCVTVLLYPSNMRGMWALGEKVARTVWHRAKPKARKS